MQKSKPVRPIKKYFPSAPRHNLLTPNAPTIRSVISSLQHNVTQLKHLYCGTHTTIHRMPKRKIEEKVQNSPKVENSHAIITANISEIQKSYERAHGKQTDNLIELYEYFKRNIEKREKSTRIMGSLELSNGNFGSSIEKEREKSKENISKIAHNKTLSNQIQQNSKRSSLLQNDNEKPSQPSKLAHQLMKQGCYNLVNVATLLNNRKYKPAVEMHIAKTQKEVKKQKEVNHQKEMSHQKEILSPKVNPLNQEEAKQISFQNNCPPICNEEKQKVTCHLLSCSPSPLKDKKSIVVMKTTTQQGSPLWSDISCKKSDRVIDLEGIPFDL